MKSFEDQIKEWEGKAHFVTPIPNIGEIPDIFKAVFEPVYLDRNLDGDDVYTASQVKETFRNGNGFKMVPDINKCRITAKGFKKLAQAAGIEWDPSEHGIVRQTADEIYFKVVAGIRKFDGHFYKINSVYTKDLRVIYDNLKDTHLSEKAFKTWIGYSNNQGKTRSDFNIHGQLKIDRDMRRNRGFIVQMAETGAKTRAINDLLTTKNTYTQKELELPFIAIKIVINYDSKNPLLQAALIAGLVESTNSLFGKAKQIKELPDYREKETIPEGELEKVISDEPEITPSTDFENASEENQLKTLREMSRDKGYTLDLFLSKHKEAGREYKDIPEETKIGLFNYINKLPIDDIPF